MAKIIWTKVALADLDSIYDFIAKESPFYAQKTIEQFLSRVEILSEFPEIGRVVPEYTKKEVREIIEGNYRLFYKVEKKGVYIIRVHHSARRIKGRKNT